jgi:hypothetical protein
VRSTAIVFALILTACSPSLAPSVDATASGRPTASATTHPTISGNASPSPRTTTPTTLDCTVSWVDHFTTVGQLTAKAEVIVRAVATEQDTVQLTPGFGARPTRDARRTTFRVVEVIKGAVAGPVRVLEDVCPNLDVRAGEEWLLFAYRWDSSVNGPPGGTEHFLTRGGPQGQFRFAGGKVSGPFFTFAGVVHSYEGAPIDEVVRDVRAALR